MGGYLFAVKLDLGRADGPPGDSEGDRELRVVSALYAELQQPSRHLPIVLLVKERLVVVVFHASGLLECHAVPGNLALKPRRNILGHYEPLAAGGVYDLRIEGLRLHHGAVAAPEIPGLGAPLLAASGRQRQEVCGHAGVSVLLRQESVVKRSLDVVRILLLAGVPEQEGRGAHHIVNGAEFLVVAADEVPL